MSSLYRNTTSYKTHAHYLSYLMCGIYIASATNEVKDDFFSGPSQRMSISSSQYSTGYKRLMPTTTPTIPVYKSDESGFTDTKFANAVSNFYGAMSAKQVKLGSDIESIIVDSLWDIYLD